MHELGIALQIIKIVEKAVPDDGGKSRVEKIHMNIGMLSGVVPESLGFCFGIAARKTRLVGSELVINEIPAAARCRDCGHGWTMDGMMFSCPACHSGGVEVVSGRELDVESIEIRD